MTESVLVREAAVRDGLQIIGALMPKADKKEWIDVEGLPELVRD